MRNRVAEALGKIEANGGIQALRGCQTLPERYDMLAKLVPEYLSWDITIARQELIFHIHHRFCVDLGVCDHYRVNEHEQRCLNGGENNECTCLMPQPYCILRDIDGKPKFPEFMPRIGLMRQLSP